MFIKTEDLDSAFEVKSQIEFITKYYSGEDDLLFGVATTEQEARVAIQVPTEQGWEKGDIVNGRIVEYISYRVDSITDWHMPDYRRQIKAPNVWETIEQMEERTGQKCTGSQQQYYIACVCRRFVNPLNGVYTYEDETNGATPIP